MYMPIKNDRRFRIGHGANGQYEILFTGEKIGEEFSMREAIKVAKEYRANLPKV